MMRVLAIGAHPDDIELGCGGTLAKHSIRLKDWNVWCATASQVEGLENPADVKSVVKGSLAELGVFHGQVIVNDLPMFQLHEHRDDLWKWLCELNSVIKPDWVLCSEADHHQDHIALHDEVLRVFFGASILTFRNLRAQGVLKSNPIYQKLEKADVDCKISSLAHYQFLKITNGTETTTYGAKRYMQPEVIKAKMICDGEWCGADYAEDFGVERLVF